jgi:hypothetical protein
LNDETKEGSMSKKFPKAQAPKIHRKPRLTKQQLDDAWARDLFMPSKKSKKGSK